jgi:signal transduction histidine kinase
MDDRPPPAPTALALRAEIRSALRRLGSPPVWWQTGGLFVSVVVGALYFAVLVPCVLCAVVFSWVVGVGTLLQSGTVRLAARMGRSDRWRIARFGGFDIAPPPVPEEAGRSFWARQQAWARSPSGRRQAVYQLARLLPAAIAAFLAVALWWTAIVFLLLGLHVAGGLQVLAWGVSAVGNVVGSLFLVLLGVVGILAWPAIVEGCTMLDARLAESLLGPNQQGLLAAEVRRLSDARSLALESAESERRRIERDLHDGLQPKLVALALDLGLARARLARDPEAARDLLDRAHEEAKTTIEDLRALVRGIQPAVLDDRGLDAALSALVAGCSVPVRVEVELDRRPERPVEAVAYFVVAEAVTNVTKHAGARQAWVSILDQGESLAVVVEDDGRGGATLDRDGGLAGLAARVAAIDGSFQVASPPGGPTRIEAVLPCGR